MIRKAFLFIATAVYRRDRTGKVARAKRYRENLGKRSKSDTAQTKRMMAFRGFHVIRDKTSRRAVYAGSDSTAFREQ